MFIASLIMMLIFVLILGLNPSYKRVWGLLGTFVLVVTLSIGCSNSTGDNSESKQKQNVEKEPTSQQKDTSMDKEVEKETDIVSVKPPVKGVNAKVVPVTDGDTIKVVLENGLSEKVRLILVDTPETKHPRLGVQPFGKEASAFTTKELTGKQVTLELDVEERDQYGRLLAYVWVGSSLFNEKLLEEGLARVAVYPPNTRYVDQFRNVQAIAQEAGKGIWSIENYAQEDGYNSDGKEEATPDSDSSSGDSYVNDPSDDQETNIACKGKIKGNANSRIYHVPGGSYYESTKDNIVWFCSEAEAEAAGYRKSKR